MEQIISPHMEQTSEALDFEVDLFEPDLSELEDPELLDLVRGGNSEAYAILFARYRHAAHRLARYLSNEVDAKDIVSESFTQVFRQLREGRGPNESFRAYLFTSIRRESGRRAKAGKRVTPTDDLSRIDKPVPFGNGEYDGFEREIARSAYESLPQRWRMVLWHIDVQGTKPHELAPQLGLKANTVSALAYRAREGLRKAYLQQHIAASTADDGPACHDIRPRIAGMVRDTAAKRERMLIEAHLETCPGCMIAFRELENVNGQLGSVTPILALSSAAPAGVGTVTSIAAKAGIAAKSVLVAVGSTAAVVATSVAVIQIPSHVPAAAGTVPIQTVSGAPQPVRADPDTDPGESSTSGNARDEATQNSLRDAATITSQPTAAPSPAASSNPPKVSVDLDERQASVSVDTPVVKARVDLSQPTKPVVKVDKVELPVKKNVVESATAPLLGHHDDDAAEE